MFKRHHVGIIGHRSWIAQHLIETFDDGTSYDLLEKRKPILGTYDCIYLFAGRARPSREEMEIERETISYTLNEMWNHPRLVYLSSMAVDLDTPYGKHKRECEMQIAAYEGPGSIISVRAGAVFGPGQPLTSSMLIPSLIREGQHLELHNPINHTKYISVYSLRDHLHNLMTDAIDWHGYGCPGHDAIPGTFTARPCDIRDLFETWDSYRK